MNYFSVIIPAYNREKELDVCINSVLQQTYPNFEVIVVDNGSTDNTKAVVAEFIKKDARVKYFWQENSGSPAGSRNTGIRKSSYDWLSFLDSDDYWKPEKLAKVNKLLTEQPNLIGVCHFEDKIVDGKFHSILRNGEKLRKPYYENLLFRGNCLSTSAMTVRKKDVVEVGLFDTSPDCIIVEDYDLWLKLAQRGDLGYVPESLGAFCITGKNLSGNIDLTNDNLKKLVIKNINSMKTDFKSSLILVHGSRIDYYKARSFQLVGNFDKAKKIIIGSIKQNPFSLKKIAVLIFCILKIKR